jgi:hypothetical protein
MVVPTLLAQLDVQGLVVEGDAIQTQRELSVQCGGSALSILLTPTPPKLS